MAHAFVRFRWDISANGVVSPTQAPVRELEQRMATSVRLETEFDRDAIRHVNRLAFDGDEEPRLVDALREGGYVRLPLVAEIDGQVVGHILFSDLSIITEMGTISALSLAPMGVLPNFQRQGIGSELVR